MEGRPIVPSPSVRRVLARILGRNRRQDKCPPTPTMTQLSTTQRPETTTAVKREDAPD